MKNFRVILIILLATVFIQTSAQNPSASFTETGERCVGQEITFTSTSTTPVGSITKEHWDFNTGNPADTANGSIVNFTYTSDGNYLPSLTVTNSSDFTDTQPLGISINPVPTPEITYDIPCLPADITFTDNSNVSSGTITNIVWTIQSIVNSDNSFTFNPGSAGNYQINLEVTSDQGCVSTLSENFDYGDEPVITFSPVSPFTLCTGESIDLTVSGGSSYVWKDGTEGPVFNVSTSGWFPVTAYTSNNCSTTDSANVTLVPKPSADAGSDQTITIGEKVTLFGSGGSNYIWSPAESLEDEFSPTTIAQPNSTTNYILTVTDANGCSDMDSVLITVELISDIPVHNMITPNGDGYNDKWDLSSIPNIETADIHVFNRWGWEVFKSEDYKNDWQGTFNGEDLPDGTYVYLINFANENQTPLRGALEILRNTQK